MKFKIRLIFIFVFLTILDKYKTQTLQPDSLLDAINNSTIDSIKFKLEQKLISFYISRNDYISAKKRANLAHQLALNSKNQNFTIQNNNRFGSIFRDMNQYDSAFTYLFKNLEIAEKTNNEILCSEAYLNIGALFLRMKNYNKANFYYKKALKIQDSIKNKRVTSDILCKLGTIAVAQKKYDEAISFLTKAETTLGDTKETSIRVNIFGNIGRIHMENGNHLKAIEYFEKTEKIGQEQKSNQVLTRAYLFLSKAYLANYKKENKNSSLAKALQYANLNYLIADEIEDVNAKCVSAEVLYNIHKLQGNANKALKYHEIYTNLNDTLIQLENNRYIADVNFKYETEKQQKIIEQINSDRKMKELALEIEKQQSRIKIIFASALICILIFLGGLLFFFYRQKQLKLYITLENEKLTSDLNFLKAQVDPHTIFNTINTIHGQLAVDVKSGRDNLVKFSELLRYQLYECNEKYVELEKEIEYLKKYIELQKLRRSGSMNLITNFTNDFKNTSITPLLFTTIVENAFKYVNKNTLGDYYININLEKKENTIIFSCENSHANSNEKKTTKKVGGIGLENLKKRLHVIYPNNHTLEINQENQLFKIKLEVNV